MKKYEVTITASVTKTVTVEAENPEDAEELAHTEFSVESDGSLEKYNQQTDDVREVP